MILRLLCAPLVALATILLERTDGFLIMPSEKQFHTTTSRLFNAQQGGSVSYSAAVSRTITPEEGRSVMDEQLMPTREYGDRIGWGRDAIGIGGDSESGAISPNDPRLSMTYAEFPLPSLDQLVDLGMTYVATESQEGRSTTTLVDIGSGCGRLVYYLALTRGTIEKPWAIHGIEISELLHDVASEYLERGVKELGLFVPTTPTTISETTSLALHCGPADQFPDLLVQADIIFAYSTAFPAPSFSPELGAMILDSEWSELLSRSCKPGCVAVTTDRALDPMYGWELVDRLDVENPEVVGSTGFVHILKR